MNKIVYSLVNFCKQEKYNKVEKLLSDKKKSLTWEDYFILSSLYLKDKEVKEDMDNGVECDGEIFGGIYTPTEFLRY